MPTTRTLAALDKFSKLPDSIRDWLTSERATLLIIDTNTRFNVAEEFRSVIPALITYLVVGEIHPSKFIEILAEELHITPSAARTLYHEIEEKILKPIEPDLQQVGVDIHLSKLNRPEGYVPRQDTNTTKNVPPKETLVQDESAQIPPPPVATPPATPEEPNEPTTPFILHEESPSFAPPAPRIQASVNFDILRAPRKAPEQKPVTAKIESPFDIKKKDLPKRIVHYSNMLTPLKNKDASQ